MRLAVVLVEFRPHPWLRPVLWNMAHVYGGTDAALYLVHGTDNDRHLRDITEGWHGAHFIQYPHRNISLEMYQDLNCDPDFYRRFPAEFLLRFEVDTVIRRRVDEVFFNYDYVGAPWTDGIRDWYLRTNGFEVKKSVGNAGFSLQRVEMMLETTGGLKRPAGLAYDVHITNQLRDDQLPPYELARSFSVEFDYFEDPCGLHKCWDYHPIEKVVALIRNLPGTESVPGVP